MPAPRFKVADLDEASLEKIRLLEEEFGTLILALSPQHPIADLPPDKLALLQKVERELGVVLIAYKTD